MPPQKSTWAGEQVRAADGIPGRRNSSLDERASGGAGRMTKVLCALDGGPGPHSMPPETTVLCWMVTVTLKIFGSKGTCAGQSPGKVKSSHKHRSNIAADTGWQLATSATRLVPLRRKGRGFLLPPTLLSAIHSQGSLNGSQMAPGLPPGERLPSPWKAVLSLVLQRNGSMWAWLHCKGCLGFHWGLIPFGSCRTPLCLSPKVS